jgi:SAM-dependent methyltransferase
MLKLSVLALCAVSLGATLARGMEQPPTHDSSAYVLKHDQAGMERLELLAREEDNDSQIFLEELNIPRDALCLSVGPGSCLLESWMAKKLVPNGYVYAIDISQECIDGGIERAIKEDAHNIFFEKMNVYDLPAEPKYDVIHTRYVLEHLQDPALAVTRMCVALKNKGKLILEDEDFYATRVVPDHFAVAQAIELAERIAMAKGVDYSIGCKLRSLIPSKLRMVITHNITDKRSSGADAVRLFCDTIHEVCEKLIGEKFLDAGCAAPMLKGLADLRQNAATYKLLSRQYRLCAQRVDEE